MKRLLTCLLLVVIVGCGAEGVEEEQGSLEQRLGSDLPTNRCPTWECGGDLGHSCFEAETLILIEAPGGSSEWVPANRITKGTRLAALGDMSTLKLPGLQARTIKTLSRDRATSALYVFSLDNGRQLKVTANHGMLLSDGRVVQARRVNIGAKFVSLDGSITRVNNLAIEHTELEVYNFEVEAAGQMTHIIAAEGVLIGDLAWQNWLASGS